jgi:regulatory protein
VNKTDSVLEVREAFSKASALCSRREYCSFDIQQKLKSWGLEPESIQTVLQQLIDEQFINDLRYATAYVSDKARLQHWGRQKITNYLNMKRIAPEIIKQALTELKEGAFDEAAMKEAQKKIKSLKAYKPFEQKSRLIRFLVGRGYDYNLSKNIVDQLIKANIENEESYE